MREGGGIPLEDKSSQIAFVEYGLQQQWYFMDYISKKSKFKIK